MSTDTITLDDLLAQCDQAMRRMSVRNHHRLLIAQCKLALIELARRLPADVTLADTIVDVPDSSPPTAITLQEPHGLSESTAANHRRSPQTAADRSIHVP